MPEIPYEPWSWVLIGLAAYVAVSFGLMYFASYFYGDDAERKIEKTIARPMWFAWEVLMGVKNGVVWVLTHPFRARFDNQFYEVFRIYPMARHGPGYTDVDIELRKRAVAFQKAGEKQTEARAIAPSADTIEEADQLVAQTKKAFWDAHRLARKAGYPVLSRYTDYLPSEKTRTTPKRDHSRGPVERELTTWR